MTISSETVKVTFAGDDATTSFGTTPVIFYDTSDLVVIVVDDATGTETLLVENTDYDVAGGSGAVGTVDLSNGSSPWGALLSGTTLHIIRDTPATQSTDLVNNDILDAEVIEEALDRLTALIQQLQEQITRVTSFDVSSAISITSGSGTPEAAVTAEVGSIFLRFDGGASTTLYVKESGSGNTGWVAK